MLSQEILVKKLILLLITLIFLTVSCSGSKKAENDVDILPDEEAVDIDVIDEESDLDEEAATHDDENNDELNDTDEDEPEDIDPCDPNPCLGIQNSTEKCTAKNAEKYSCGCIKNHFWNGEECLDPCNGIDCGQIEHAVGECKSKNAFVFSCDCDEGFFWYLREKKCLKQTTNVCTGQSKCYDNEKEIPCPAEGEEFFGQDAQYAALGKCVPQSFFIDYSVADEPVVIDNNLGLMWQRNIPPIQELYRNDVLEYCEELNYGGYNDWRLPTEKEFMTIVDYGKYDPAIDTEYFPDYGAFWSTATLFSNFHSNEFPYLMKSDTYHTIFDFSKPYAFYVHTLDSEMDYIGTINEQHSYPYSYDLRCVRGDGPALPEYYFTSEAFGDNMMWSNSNDLIFIKKANANHTWSEALKYCSELDYAGISDWRLPNIKELTISQYGKSHTSTTQLADSAIDYSYIQKESSYNDSSFFSEEYDYDTINLWFDHFNASYAKQDRTADTFCITNDPCESGLFWNGVKCVKNPCAGNPCTLIAYSDKICKVIDEENYSCGCTEGYKLETSTGKLRCIKN